MAVAQMLGGRFAVVRSGSPMCRSWKKTSAPMGGKQGYQQVPGPVFQHGLEQVHSRRPRDSKDLLADFEPVALSCIEDGADVIVVGCGYLGPVLTLLNYREIREPRSLWSTADPWALRRRKLWHRFTGGRGLCRAGTRQALTLGLRQKNWLLPRAFRVHLDETDRERRSRCVLCGTLMGRPSREGQYERSRASFSDGQGRCRDRWGQRHREVYREGLGGGWRKHRLASRKFENCVAAAKEVEALGVRSLPVQCDLEKVEDMAV